MIGYQQCNKWNTVSTFRHIILLKVGRSPRFTGARRSRSWPQENTKELKEKSSQPFAVLLRPFVLFRGSRSLANSGDVGPFVAPAFRLRGASKRRSGTTRRLKTRAGTPRRSTALPWGGVELCP
jgi:hypothetical protein